MEILMKYLWLTLKELSYKKMSNLFEYFGSIENIYLANDYSKIPNLTVKDIKALNDKSMTAAQNVYKRCIECGARIMTIEDENYPKSLKEIDSPPYVLYIKGRDINLNNEFCIGIVGTRQATTYGSNVTARFSTALSKRDIVTVSGLAMGIDSVVAYAATKIECPTIGVLGCGIDMVYPKNNKDVYDRVEKYGMIISEYPPGKLAMPWTFPQRNRIIAGLSKGVIVIEGTKSSGSMITARFALEFNRDVFAVPRNIDDDLNGTNLLIKQGAAVMTCVNDLIEYYPELKDRVKAVGGGYVLYNNEQLEMIEEKEEEEKIKFSVIKRDDPLENTILQFISHKTCHIDNIAEGTGLDANLINMKLIMLEIDGILEKLPGQFYRIRQ